MPVNGVWRGCGHKVRDVRMKSLSGPSMREIANFQTHNEKDQCFECWKKQNKLTLEMADWKHRMNCAVSRAYMRGFDCPKCRKGIMTRDNHIWVKDDVWFSRMRCDSCENYYDVSERPCPKCGSPDMITRPDGSASCPNAESCDYKEGVSAEGL